MSNMSNIRMDSYIYTRESFAQAYHLLQPDGVMVVNFGADDSQGRRTTRSLTDATGMTPRSFRNELQLLFEGRQNTYVIDPSNRLDQDLKNDALLAKWASTREAHWTPDTDAPDVCDDWPYWFLPRKAIPSLQLVVMIFITIVSVLLFRLLLPGSKRRVSGHFLFLGAAFMLLEVHSISRVALLLGATWMPNAFVISAVLIMIILANMVTAKFRPDRRLSYLLLFVSLALQFIPQSLYVDPSSNGSLALTLFIYALPIFFAGLIFGRSFESSAHADDALRSNLIGAVCGGMLESLSFIYGMHALVYLIFGLYGLSALFAPRNDTTA